MHPRQTRGTRARRRVDCHPGVVGTAAILWLSLLGCTHPASTYIPGGPLTCPSGHIASPKGDCMPVGIQDCADIFIEDDGLCRPSIDKCPAGTIPKFTQGCVPVGIQGCAAIFMKDDGLCHPSIDKCPAGMIPKFDEGCVPVGIPNCAPEFMEPDGICHPRMAKCPAGTFAVPQKGCIPIDGPAGCGTGTWGHIADGPNTVWVDPTYPNADSDGSKAKPVTTIAAAMALVATGGRIALAAGIYPEGVMITKTMTLEGRCPSMVRIEGNVPTNSPTYPAGVYVKGASGVALRAVQIGGTGWGIDAESSPGLIIDGVHVRNATDTGIYAGAGTTVSILNTFIEGTLATTNHNARGLSVTLANVTLNETAVAGTDGISIDAVFHADLTAADVLVEGTGSGIEALFEGHVFLHASAIVANVEVGLFAALPGMDVTVDRSLIEGTLPNGSKADGRGIMVQEEAKATLTGNIVVKNRRAGIFLWNSADTTISGNLILDTLPEESTQSHGDGLVVVSGAHTIVNDNAIIGNHSNGILSTDMPLELTASRNLVERTLSGGPMNVDYDAGIRMCSS